MPDESLSGLQGALGGAGTGAALGSLLLPGVGTVLGALVGGGIGMASGVNKARDVNDSMNALNAIPEIDPNQVMFRDKLVREKRAVESGFSTDFQVARDIISKSEAGGMSVASEIAKTNPALALMTMNQVGMGADTSVNKALGTIGTKGMGYTQMISELVDKMSARQMQIQIMKATQGLGTSTKALSDFNANSWGGMMQLATPEVSAGFKKFGGMFGKSGGVSSSGIGAIGDAVAPILNVG